jgi:hypothetical protein
MYPTFSRRTGTLPTFGFALIALSLGARAQVHLDWSATYSSPAQPIDYAQVIAVDGAGNAYIAGSSQESNGSTGSLFVAAFDSTGSQSWVTTYDGPQGGNEQAQALVLDGAGSIYVAGIAKPTTLFASRALLIKLTTAGGIVWSREFGLASGSAYAQTLVIDGNGHILVGGKSAVNQGDMSVAAFDADGARLWETTYDASSGGPDAAAFIALMPNGDSLAAGAANLASPGPETALMRLDPNGGVVWQRTYSPAGYPYSAASGLVVDATGRAFIALTATPDNNQHTVVALAAFDAGGNELWFQKMPGTIGHEYTSTSSIALDPFGRVLLSGTAWTAPLSYGDIVVGAFDVTRGNVAWTWSIDNPGGTPPPAHMYDTAGNLLVDATGNAFLVGSTGYFLDDQNRDVVALGLDPQGALRFLSIYGVPPAGSHSLDGAIAGALSGTDALWIAGQAQTLPNNNGFDALVIRLTRTAQAFCFGDGSGTACPCSNATAPVEVSGCKNSHGAGGRLIDSGMSSIAQDTLALLGTGMPNSTALYIQGTTSISPGLVLGDGLRCVGGSLVRLGIKTNSAGASQYPGPSDASVSVRGSVTLPGTHTYQVWYRDSASFCTPDTFNLTNGLSVVWTP